jgi:hypothetical protein
LSSPPPAEPAPAAPLTPHSDPTAPATPATPTPPQPNNTEKAGPNRQSIEQQIESVQHATQLDEATKAELLKRYKAALDWINTAEEAVKKTAQYQAEIAAASDLVAQVKAQLAAPVSETPATFAADTTLAQMEQGLSQAETQLKEAETELADRDEELKRRGERKTELAKLTGDSRGQPGESEVGRGFRFFTSTSTHGPSPITRRNNAFTGWWCLTRITGPSDRLAMVSGMLPNRIC